MSLSLPHATQVALAVPSLAASQAQRLCPECDGRVKSWVRTYQDGTRAMVWMCQGTTDTRYIGCGWFVFAPELNPIAPVWAPGLHVGGSR